MRKSVLFFMLTIAVSLYGYAQQTNAGGTAQLLAGQWSVEKVNEWYAKQAWIVGCNFVPSTAINDVEFWQDETFDLPTIDKELGLARAWGINSVRVFLNYVVWEAEAEKLKSNFRKFLDVAEKHGISVMPVLFDDCNFSGGVAKIGKQPNVVKDANLTAWVSSPPAAMVRDESQWQKLKAYEQDMVKTFRKDKRIIIWDLYNEPGNSESKIKPELLANIFAWAREAKPSQPLTVGAWLNFSTELSKLMRDHSDIVSFHAYDNKAGVEEKIRWSQSTGRPAVCTEWLLRQGGNTPQVILPLFKEKKVGGYNWGLVNGKTQTHAQGGSTPQKPKINPWQHDLMHNSGAVYDSAELHLFRTLAGNFVTGRDDVLLPDADIKFKDGKLYFENNLVGKLSGEMTEGIAITSETLVPLGDNTFKVVRTYKAEKDTDSARICFDYVHSEKANWWMIPAVSYNGNHWGSGKEPKGAEENGVFRTFSFRRTPIPGCTYSEGDRFAVAVWSDNPKLESQHFSCCIMPEEVQTAHRIILPEEEMPTNYYNLNQSKQGYRKALKLKKNETVTLTLYINVNPVEPNHAAYRLFLKKAWELAEKPDIKIPDADTLWKYSISYPRDVLYTEIKDGDKKFCGFIMAFQPDYKGGYGPLFGVGFYTGWVGRNVSVGAALLGDYVKRKDEKSKKMGLDVLDSWCKYCVLPNGLLRTGFSGFQRLADGADANNLSDAAVSFFMAADLVRQCGVERPEYEKTAYGICDFVMRDQQPGGQYARSWNAEGKAGSREGTVCAAMVLPMMTAYQRSGNKLYLESARKAVDYYCVMEFMRDGFTTAGALDTHCIDKESAVPLLNAVIPLYEATGEKKYLDYAVQLSYYLSTWLWHYGGVYPPDDDLTVFSYNTFGATSVSVQHNCLDEYGLLLVPRWLKLAEYTGDRQWKEKAIAVWKNSCQSISDGTFEVHGTVRPMGAQSESFFMCNYWLGHYPHNHEKWRMNDWWVLWPVAMRLEVMRTLGKDVDVLYESINKDASIK